VQFVVSKQLTPVNTPDVTGDPTYDDGPHVPAVSTAYIGRGAADVPTATHVELVAQLTALKCPDVEGLARSTEVPQTPEVSVT
jgi:hypothetical protein